MLIMPKIEKRPTFMGETALYCDFTHNGQKYFADLTPLPDIGIMTECMIFPYKKGKIDFCNGLYCRRNIPVTKELFISCIKEFIEELKE